MAINSLDVVTDTTMTVNSVGEKIYTHLDSDSDGRKESSDRIFGDLNQRIQRSRSKNGRDGSSQCRTQRTKDSIPTLGKIDFIQRISEAVGTEGNQIGERQKVSLDKPKNSLGHINLANQPSRVSSIRLFRKSSRA